MQNPSDDSDWEEADGAGWLHSLMQVELQAQLLLAAPPLSVKDILQTRAA